MKCNFMETWLDGFVGDKTTKEFFRSEGSRHTRIAMWSLNREDGPTIEDGEEIRSIMFTINIYLSKTRWPRGTSGEMIFSSRAYPRKSQLK